MSTNKIVNRMKTSYTYTYSHVLIKLLCYEENVKNMIF